MLNTWFHDLYDNLPDHEPRYWHVFIGTNNKYGVALPLNDKKASSIHNTLEEFINTYHPAKLTSDEEPGFLANIQLLKDNDVTMHINTHTVCVPYYKATPYNISHTKIFSRAK